MRSASKTSSISSPSRPLTISQPTFHQQDYFHKSRGAVGRELPICLSSAIFLSLVRRSASTLADAAGGGIVRFNAVTGLVANGVFVRTGHDDSHANQRKLRAHAILYVVGTTLQSGRLWGIVGGWKEGRRNGVGECASGFIWSAAGARASFEAVGTCVADNLTRPF